MALISMIQKKVVEKDQMLENQTVMEGISLASVLPGPMAVNVVSFVGYKLGGVRGAIASVVAVLIPSFLLMLVLSHFYLQYGDIPAMTHFFLGVSPAVAAVIASVALTMGTKSIKDYLQGAVALITAVIITISKSYLSTLGMLILSGLFGYFYYTNRSLKPNTPVLAKTSSLKLINPKYIISTVLIVMFCCAIFLVKLPNGLLSLHKSLVITFSGMSLSQFGGGYVIIPTMQKIIVDGMKWLSDKEFVDAIAMGQITPGPIFISATFIGYKLAGFWGALNATISIFFPTALLMIVCTKFFNQISNSSVLDAVFKGLRPSIIGMIISASITMMLNNSITLFSASIFTFSLILVARYKVDPVYVIPAAGIAGLLIL